MALLVQCEIRHPQGVDWQLDDLKILQFRQLCSRENQTACLAWPAARRLRRDPAGWQASAA
jgi:hypothetical protein